MRNARRVLTALTATGAVLATTLALGVTASSAAGTQTGGLQHYGAQLHLLWSANTQANVDRELDLLAATGANSARLDVSWSSLQISGRGIVSSSYTSRIDAVVAGARARGINLVLVLHTTPCWASSAPETLKQNCEGAYWDRGVTRYPPTDNADFAWAAAWVAERYSSRIAALELWNEPNLVIDGVTPLIAVDQAATYAGMVKAAYPAVKRVAPALPVLAGAMSFADDVFLKALYAHGIRGHYDGISVHPYNEWRAPGAAHDPRWYKYDYVLGLEAVRRAMTAAGDTSPVWVTEVGWTTCAPGSDRWCVTREQQAAYTKDLVALTAARFPWVRSLLIYNLRDKGTDASSTEDNFGLVTRDYTPKPALAALGQAFAALGGSTAPVAPTPTSSPTSTTSPTPTTSPAPTSSPTPTTSPAPTTSPSPAPSAPTAPAPAFQVVTCPQSAASVAVTVVLCQARSFVR